MCAPTSDINDEADLAKLWLAGLGLPNYPRGGAEASAIGRRTIRPSNGVT